MSGLDTRLVELAILVTAREMDCEYVWTAHEPAARKAGLQQEIIDIVKFRRPRRRWPRRTPSSCSWVAMRWASTKWAPTPFARAEKLFGTSSVVNIVALMGDYAATTMMLNVADQHVRPKDKSLLPR
jgi:4-carboxymuconolactone decarboxylase